jgi:hypothetical protein
MHYDRPLNRCGSQQWAAEVMAASRTFPRRVVLSSQICAAAKAAAFDGEVSLSPRQLRKGCRT